MPWFSRGRRLLNAACPDAVVRKWYERYLAQLYDDAKAKLPDLERLQSIAAAFESRRVFLTQVTRSSRRI